MMSLLRHNAIRIISLFSLFLALADASMLLGMHTGRLSPIVMMGVTGFILLAFFTVLRLFAAVGLWIGASWGAALLILTTVLEIAAIISGMSTAPYAPPSIGIRILLALCVAAIFGVNWWQSRDVVHD